MKKLVGSFLIFVFVFGLVMTSAAEKVEVRISWWGNQARHDATIKVIEMFEKDHPDIKIIYEFSGWDDHWTRLATQAAGGNLPDIMQHDYARLSEWVGNGLLMPLDEFVEAGVLDFSNVADANLDGGRIDGKLYGVNLGTNSMCFVLNVDLFKKAGVDLPPQQWTWADFEKISLELHEKLGMLAYAGNTLIHDHLWKALYLSKGEWVYSDDGKSLGYTDDQPLIDHLKMIQRLQKAGALDSRGNELAYLNVPEQTPFNIQKAAMNFMWSNQPVGLQAQYCPDCNYKLALVPRLEGGKSANYVKPSMFFSITRDAKHPKEAAMFIDFFTNSVEANKILMAGRGVPVSSVVKEGLKSVLTPIQIEVFEFLGRVEADSVPVPVPDPVGHADVRNNVFYPELVDPVLYGQISPEEGVATFRELANEILAK